MEHRFYRQDFCMTSARLYPLILQKDSLQYTMGKSTIWALASKKELSAENEKKKTEE